MRRAKMVAARPVGGPVQADPYARYRFVGTWFALVIMAASAAEFLWNVRHPTARDFVSFWGAAQLALAGHPSAAYDNAALHAVQSAVADFGNATAEMPFPYPPAYLLLVLPFGLLTFAAGFAAWTTCTFVMYMAAARKLMPLSGWLAAAFPCVYANAALGQNGFLTAAIFMGGLALLERRPFTAGMVLGCLVIKPQLGLLLPVAFIAARQWRSILGAALSSCAILLLGAVLLGFGTTLAWLRELPLYAAITRDGLVGWSKLASVYAAGRQFGLSPLQALAMHGVVALAAAYAVWEVWRTSEDAAFRVGMLSAATALASPYLFFYDQAVAVPAFLLLLQKERPALLFALWCLPLLQIAQIGGISSVLNLNVVEALALTILVYIRWRQELPGSGGPAEDRRLSIQQPSPVTLS